MRGEMIDGTLDGERIGLIVYDPDSITIISLSKGQHETGLLLFGNRINTFGAVQNCDNTWYGDKFSLNLYDYYRYF